MNEEVLYKCAWTPFHDYTFSSAISKTFVNGNLVYNNGKIQEQGSGQRLTFRV
jgi:dihydroorotase